MNSGLPQGGRTCAVVIIGGGAAGLSTAAALQVRGIDAVILERGQRVGDSWRNRYERLHLHTHRRWSGLAHRSIPSDRPKYMSKDAYAAYLEQYAQQLGLDIRFNCEVTRVRLAGANSAEWQLTTACGIWNAKAVVIATGLYRAPIRPPWFHSNRYRGTLVHAQDFRSGAQHAGDRALVVGIGNSGAEIAAELATAGAQSTAISVRTVPPITPRDIARVVPSQFVGIVLTRVPARLADALGNVFRRFGPDLSPWKLHRPGWSPFRDRRPPVIDVGFLEQLERGRIDVLAPVVELTATGARFADDTERDFDLIVAATGYEPALDQLVEGLSDPQLPGGPRRRAETHGLHFVGFEPTLRGQLYEIRHSSLRVARDISVRFSRTRQAR